MKASFDWNSGIREVCQYCGQNGFLYYNQSLEHSVAMCDACRDDIERRKEHLLFRSTVRAASPETEG